MEVPQSRRRRHHLLARNVPYRDTRKTQNHSQLKTYVSGSNDIFFFNNKIGECSDNLFSIDNALPLRYCEVPALSHSVGGSRDLLAPSACQSDTLHTDIDFSMEMCLK